MAPQRTAGQQRQGHAARTRAAARQQQQHAADMVLPLLLQHDSIRTQLPLVCKLLCCSKWLAAAVAEHCAGQLDMPDPLINKEAETVAWLRRHARLLRLLNIYIEDTRAFVAALVAAGPQSLMLQSLALEASDTSLPLLEQLPASCLTHVSFSTWQESTQPKDRPAFVARWSAALDRLTSLCSLARHRSEDDDVAPGLCSLSALTQLTGLHYCGPLSDLQHAPPQLLELEVMGCSDEKQQQQLHLRHLSAATVLSIPSLAVKEGDVLPPNLLRLQAEHCSSAKPLLPLVQLQQLQVKFDGTDMTADQLRQLSRLTALDLRYGGRTEPACAGAWPLLPLLQRLVLDDSILSSPVCQRLAQLSGLTSLVLRSFKLPQAGSAQQLAAGLRQLSGLQRLELADPRWPPATTAEDAKAAGGQQLLQALGSLQQLRELCFQHFLFVAANSSSLTALTALMALELSNCGLTDADVTTIASQLPGLQSLDCFGNADITDAALPAIGRLQQLTQLLLSRTSVSGAGLRWLTRLTLLRKLCVPYLVPAKQRRWLQRQLPDVRAMYF